MGRDIYYPAGEIYDCWLNTKQSYIHTCYESYRGYKEEHRQYGKRIVVGQNDGIIKKGPKFLTLEEQAFAPTNYAKYWDVRLEPGDFVIVSFRTQMDFRKTYVELDILRFEKQGAKINFSSTFGKSFEIDDFTETIKLSEQAWSKEIDEKLRKGVKKALKMSRRAMQASAEDDREHLRFE